MMLQTERLELVALTLDQLKLWIENLPALEKELNCSYRAEPMEGFFLDIVRSQYEITRKDCDRYMWHSFFFIIRREDRVVVGSADFKDVPNKDGEVEIGYGLGKEYEHNGYMTEAAKAMCAWALEQTGVSTVLAETDLDGFSSHRVLERCGFKRDHEAETLWWRL